MVNARLMVLNTGVSYVRSILSACLTLFSTRWLLAALGKQDMGLYYTVGGVVVFLSFINTSMAFSSQRYFAFAMGKGGDQEVHNWFNSAFSLHALLSIIILIGSVPLGLVAFTNWLTIPEGRLETCRLVYVFSVLTACGSIFSVPYCAIYMARQRIYELTVIQMLNTIALFALAWYLTKYDRDTLLLYAGGVLVINLGVYVVQIARCRWIFPECKLDFKKMLDKGRYKSLLTFSGWSMSSTFAFMFRGQGIALLLNNFGTSGTNAAYSIAGNVSSQTAFLANGFMNAITPEITIAYGAGKKDEMVALANSACKFATLLVLFILVPLFSDVEPVLSFWLKNVPENTASFARIVLVSFLAIQSVLGVSVANKAYGKIALPQIFATVFLLLAVPLGYAAIKLGLGMEYVVGTFSATQIMCSVSVLGCAWYLYRFPVMKWLKEVLLKNGFVAFSCLFVNGFFVDLMQPTILRPIAIGFLDALVIVALGWCLVLSNGERKFLKNKFYQLIGKLNG